jgi:hypothetical protein
MSALYGMTVGQLKALLATMPESYNDRVVVLSSDPEGNSYDTLSDVGVGWYRDRYEGEFHGSSLNNDDTWEGVEAQVTKEYLTDEDADEDDEDAEPVALDEHDHPAICLWP